MRVFSQMPGVDLAVALGSRIAAFADTHEEKKSLSVRYAASGVGFVVGEEVVMQGSIFVEVRALDTGVRHSAFFICLRLAPRLFQVAPSVYRPIRAVRCFPHQKPQTSVGLFCLAARLPPTTCLDIEIFDQTRNPRLRTRAASRASAG